MMSASASRRASGRILVRLDPGLHASLREAARSAGTSLNRLVEWTLAAAGGRLAAEGAVAAVRAAARVAGADLVGVVAFGSWARGEAGPGSDVDVLVVVRETCGIERGLYRRWDEQPPTWDGLPVEPHFVHLPPKERPVAGIWAEAAMDGIVLWDPTLVVSRRLVSVRHDILAGRIVRREAYGQPYWTVAA